MESSNDKGEDARRDKAPLPDDATPNGVRQPAGVGYGDIRDVRKEEEPAAQPPPGGEDTGYR